MQKILYHIYVERNFNEILIEFLEENEISQSEFARRIGVKPGLVNDWIRGKAKPGYDSIKQMSLSFNVTADYFLGLTDNY